MKVIVGLGNPGRDYDQTRHNAGFMTVDELARRHAPMETAKARFQAATVEARIGPEKCLLMKPTTYMNLSGRSVGEALRFYKLEPETDLLVITDDIALPVGAIRVRAKGGAGGHNGLNNIDTVLGGKDYARVRVGVGAVPRQMNQADWVLSRFTEGERGDVDRSIKEAADAVECVMADDVKSAMNRFNKKVEAQKPETHPAAESKGERPADADPGWFK